MLEPLGRSQVLPYLGGLARAGAKITIISFEKASATDTDIESFRATLAERGLTWEPLRRDPSTHLAMKVREAARAVGRALAASMRTRPDIVHGRSYLPASVADVVASAWPSARAPKLLFDCRGMLGDEYVDAGHWTPDRLEYRLLKRYERRVFRRADGVVILTHALVRWLRERDVIGAAAHVEVVPCCVDTARFVRDAAARTRVRDELGIGDRLVVVYSGSLGSWYREPDMARFVGELVRCGARPVFLVLTHNDASELSRLVRAQGLPEGDLVVRKVAPDAMPAHLSAADVGLSFITSCFSKKGSSPTKLGEYLACGLVSVLNGDIGDQADMAAHENACVVVDDFSNAALARAAERTLALLQTPEAERVQNARIVAERELSLDQVGVPGYLRLYSSLASGSSDSDATAAARQRSTRSSTIAIDSGS